MNRRQFLFAGGAAWLALDAPAATGATRATVLFQDQTVELEKIRPDPKDLWVRAADLPRINRFTLKPQGACRADMCIPVPKALKSGEWFNLTGFAQRLHQSYVELKKGSGASARSRRLAKTAIFMGHALRPRFRRARSPWAHCSHFRTFAARNC